MKTTILIGAFLMLVIPTFAQKKSELESQNKKLTAQLDSVTGQLKIYTGVYDVLKEKVFKYSFDPARTSALIDSLKTSRDSLLLSLQPKSEPNLARDSVIMLKKQNQNLTAKVDSIQAAWDYEKNLVPYEELEKAKSLTNLKQLKELLDQKIINDAEFAAMKKKYIDKL